MEGVGKTGLFDEVTVRKYPWEAEYDAASYVRLLSTYSGHLGRVSKPSAVGIVLARNRPYSANIAPSGLPTGLCRAPKRRF